MAHTISFQVKWGIERYIVPAKGSPSLYQYLFFDDTVIPLGNLNPPGHTLPTDHIYFYIKATAPDQSM